jgi:energy-coupling factor transporter ATP-binding protein EcfA2
MNIGRQWNARGSEWHRWDPHIHAPGTVLADEFGGDWEGYLTRIEEATPAVRVLGITDYLCIQAYKTTCALKAKGRLRNVELIFPNVEMRLDVKTARDKGINLHLLFSPKDPKHEEQIERILGRLTFEYQDSKYSCSRSELISLGRKCAPRQTDERGAFRAGVEQFKVNMNELRQLFKDEVWMRKNCLVAVASSSGDGVAGLQSDGAFQAIRQEIQRFANIIFSSKDSDREFWLGKKTGIDRASIERMYRSLKPCLHGCDAHGLDRVAAPDQNRYCWIKGDLDFEGLRQAVIEPEERVAIGEDSPAAKANSVTIETIRPISMPWLQNEEVKLNRGLVSIIGERGSGKTALVDMIAAGAEAISMDLGESSFLRRASSPDDLLGDAEVEEVWADGEKTRVPFRPPNEWEERRPQVRYLSQQFVDRLCSSGGLAVELRQEIERVIFDQIDPTERFETDSFDDLAELLLDPIRRRRALQSGSIRTASTKIVAEAHLREQLPKLTTDFNNLSQQIAKARKDLVNLIPKEKEKHAQRLVDLEKACADAESRIEGLRRQEKSLENLLSEADFFVEQDSDSRLAELRERYSEAELTDKEWENFKLRFSGDVSAVVANSKRVLEKKISINQNGDPENPVDLKKTPLAEWPLVDLKTARDAIKKEVGIDELQHKKYEALKRTITTNDSTLRKLETSIKNGAGADDRLRGLREERRRGYRSVFDTFSDEAAALKELYAPLHKQIEDCKGALAKLRFTVKRHVDLSKWVRAGEDLMDLRMETDFRGNGALEIIAKQELLGVWRDGTSEDVATAMHEFVTKHSQSLRNTMPGSVEPGGATEWQQQIGSWLYSTEHIDIRYGIEYDGVAVERLSPGTRGIVLLLLYLVIDRSDRRPLLIDQPEENLDPKSVFDDLVPHFRQARLRRQVIIVTHNANLVVNTDADQVIVATSKLLRLQRQAHQALCPTSNTKPAR